MISCKQAARLISLSLDARLTLRQRWMLWFHLRACSMCRRFLKQARLLQLAGRRLGRAETPPDAPQHRLSDEARRRIEKALPKGPFGGQAD